MQVFRRSSQRYPSVSSASLLQPSSPPYVSSCATATGAMRWCWRGWPGASTAPIIAVILVLAQFSILPPLNGRLAFLLFCAGFGGFGLAREFLGGTVYGQLFARASARRGWSQAELADQLNVSRQTVNALETGRYDPSLPLAFQIARLFKSRIEEVFKP